MPRGQDVIQIQMWENKGQTNLDPDDDKQMATDALLFALSILRGSPLLLLLFVTASLGLKPSQPVPQSPSTIRNVVIADIQPRRAIILAILVFAAFTYLLDGVLVAVLLIKDGVREGSTQQWRGIELADVAGLLAFAGLALLGSSKDSKGVDFWFRKRVKAFAFFALVLDIAYLVLILLGIPIFPHGSNALNVPNFLHFLAVAARLAVLLPLLPILYKPARYYTSLQPAPAEPTSTSQLLASDEAGGQTSQQAAYGTFASAETSLLPGTPAITVEPYEVQGSTSDGATAVLEPVARSRKSSKSGKSSRSSSKGKGKKSRSRSSSRSGKAAKDFVDTPEQIESKVDAEVPVATTNPVTDDPETLNTSYAANAAASLDKEAKESNDEGKPKAEDASQKNAPIAFPVSPVTEEPLAFPTSDDASSAKGTPGGIQFTADTQETPRSGTPEPDAEKKRKRISSQNFQRIARRISLVPKRTASSSSTKDKEGTPKKEGSGFLARLQREDSRASGENSRASIDSQTQPGTPDSEAKGKGRFKDMKKRMSIKL